MTSEDRYSVHWFDFPKLIAAFLLIGMEIWIITKYWQLKPMQYPFIGDRTGHLVYLAVPWIGYASFYSVWAQISLGWTLLMVFGFFNSIILYVFYVLLWAFDQRVPILKDGIALIRHLIRSLILAVIGAVAFIITGFGMHEPARAVASPEIQKDVYYDLRHRHQDPSSTFVLPEIAKGIAMSDHDAETLSWLKGYSPESIEGFNTPYEQGWKGYQRFYWVNSQAEYDETPIGDWMKDPQGNVARKVIGSESHPIVVHSQEEEDKLPSGTWVTSANGNAIERKDYIGTLRFP